MQVCTSLQTDNHARTPPLSFTGRMPFLPPNQQRQSTDGKKTLKVKAGELFLMSAFKTWKISKHDTSFTVGLFPVESSALFVQTKSGVRINRVIVLRLWLVP